MQIAIPPNDPRVHVLAVSDGDTILPEQTYLAGPASDPAPLTRALGADVALAHVELFKVRDLLPLGLRDYLHQAHDVPLDALSADAGRLDALDGRVMVLAPAALKQVTALQLSPVLTHIGAYGAPVPDDSPQAMPRARPETPARATPLRDAARSVLPFRWLVAVALGAAALLVLWVLG